MLCLRGVARPGHTRAYPGIPGHTRASTYFALASVNMYFIKTHVTSHVVHLYSVLHASLDEKATSATKIDSRDYSNLTHVTLRMAFI